MSSVVPLASSCVASTFPTPSLLGAEFLSLEANLVTDYSVDIPEGWMYSQPSVNVQNATFCNITVSYTHPGENDTIYVETWLPTENYNGRLQAIGGGGWAAGRFVLSYFGMAGAIYNGYASVTTDAGLGTSLTYQPWALLSPGNLNLYNLQNIGLVSLNDEAVIAKSLINSFYGQAPVYSYWNGCSHGGRQGAMLAQQYPTAYNGIIAAAPALDWAGLVMSTIWPIFYMDSTGQYPQGCELEQLTSLAISVCDGLDGVKDGLIADPEACRQAFDASDYVGVSFNCSDTGVETKISTAAVAVADALWTGARHADGRFLWHGFEMGADLTTAAPTNCTDDGQCTAAGLESIAAVYDYWVSKDLNTSTANFTHKDFDSMYRSLKQVFASFMATTEADITEFRDAGGKMITFHGLADPTIPPNNSLSYYKEVSNTVEDTFDFYRYYRVPGLQHCWGGQGGQPESLFSQLRQWVENGTAPGGSSVTVTLSDGTSQGEVLCPYPQKATFNTACSNSTYSNSTASSTCWSCTQ